MAKNVFIQYQWVPANTLSSMKVTSRNSPPEPPLQVSPIGAAVFRKGDVIPLAWMNRGGAIDYQIEIYLNSVLIKTIPWQSDPVKFIDSLEQGSYSWWYQNIYGNYENGKPNSGSLTSPPFSISSAGYYLRFYYRYQTETQGKNWDQRWVQVSVDQGPFMNLVQLYDDPQIPETSSWLRNKAINLTAYAGHVIRVRFLFSTLDAAGNNYSGWGIDDFSITATPPQNCNENR